MTDIVDRRRPIVERRSVDDWWTNTQPPAALLSYGASATTASLCVAFHRGVISWGASNFDDTKILLSITHVNLHS